MADGRIVIETELDPSGVQKGVNDVNKNLDDIGNTVPKTTKRMVDQFGNELDAMGRVVKRTYSGMSDEARAMSAEMQSAFREQGASMNRFRDDMIKVEHGYFKMAKGSREYSGTSKQFMGDIAKMGAEHKRINDNMIKNNEMAKMSFFQSVGQMVSMSTQASKIGANYERMSNPLLKVNKAGLAVADGLNKIALKGQPAAVALRMLGPTANMKELQDMTGMISQGLMRFPMVAMAAAAGAALFYTAMFKAAMGPNPGEIRAKQAELTNVYKEAYNERVTELMSFADLFEEVSAKSVNPETLTKGLRSQVVAMKTWTYNMKGLAKKGVDEGLLQELQKIGPKGAMQVKALNSMSERELTNYVSLWREKMRTARTQAASELEGLKAETQAKIKALQASLTPLGIAVEGMKNAWVQAIKPMVAVFGMVMTPVVNFIARIGEMISKFNEAYPTIAKVVGGILLLVPALTLLLSPLAIGVGFLGGFLAAWGAVWALIGPLVTGLAAMSATVWIVAAAIVGLIAVFIILYQKSETFRTAVLTAWDAIKAGAMAVFNFLKPYITAAMTAVTTFVQQKLAQMKQFWAENGTQIMAALGVVWAGIKAIVSAGMAVLGPILTVGFAIIKAIVVSTWNAIKNVINGALNIIKGIIQVFSGLFTADFGLMWEGIKNIFKGALELIWGVINLYFIGKLLGPIKAFAGLAKTAVTGAWNGMKAAITTAMASIRSGITSAWNGIRSTMTAALNSIKSNVLNVFNAIKNVVSSVMSAVKSVIQTYWNGVKSIVTSVLNAVKNHVTNVFNGMKSIITGVMNAIKSVIQAQWNAAKSIVQGVVSAIKAIVRGDFNALKGIVSTAMTGVKTAIVNGWNQAKAFLEGIDLTSIGRDIISGLAGGITDAMGEAVRAVQNVGESIMGAAAKVFNTNSPSKRMRDEVGKQLPAGIAVGVNANTRPAMKAMQNLGNEMMMRTPRNFASSMAKNGSMARPSSAPQTQMINNTIMLDTQVIGRAVTPVVNGRQNTQANFKTYMQGGKN